MIIMEQAEAREGFGLFFWCKEGGGRAKQHLSAGSVPGAK